MSIAESSSVRTANNPLGCQRRQETAGCHVVVAQEALEELTCDMAPDQLIWSALSDNKARMKKLVYATWRTVVKDARRAEILDRHRS
jgi:hypothetical protein